MTKIKKAAGYNQTASFNYNANYTKNQRNKKHFNRSKLPNIVDFYMHEQGRINIRGKWIMSLCCFHNDHNPSLSINAETGSFRCFSCDACGNNIIDFFMQKHGCDFKTAAQSLGAWDK